MQAARAFLAFILASAFGGTAVFLASRAVRGGHEESVVVGVCGGFLVLGILAAVVRKRALDSTSGPFGSASRRVEFAPSIPLLFAVGAAFGLMAFAASMLRYGEDWFYLMLASAMTGFGPGYALLVPEDRGESH